MDFGSEALVLAQVVCCCCCWSASCHQGIWCAKCLRQVNQSFVPAIVIVQVAFVQYIARAVPSTYDSPNRYLFLLAEFGNHNYFNRLWE